MKAGWKTVKLGEACKIVNGATPSTSVEANWGGPHCWITPAEMGGLSDPYVRETRRTLTDAGLADCSASMLPAGSVILSSRAPIGHVIINTVPMATNQGCKSMIPRSDLDAKFLFYFIKANVPLLESLGTGATFKELSGGKLASVEIPLPTLAEQKRIVALLDEAFAGIDEAKAKVEVSLASAQKLTENYFQSVIDRQGRNWTPKQLSELCDIKHGYAFEGEFFSNKGNYVLLTPGNFYERGGYRDRGEKQKYYTGEIPREYVLNKGDLLVEMTEQAAGLLGSPIMVPESDKFLHNQRLGLVTKKPEAPWTNKFFFHIFNSPFVRKSIHDSASGVKVRHTSPRKIGDVVVTVPSSTSEQDEIVGIMESLDEYTKSLTSLYQQKQSALSQLKQSLLTQAFAGELTA